MEKKVSFEECLLWVFLAGVFLYAIYRFGCSTDKNKWASMVDNFKNTWKATILTPPAPPAPQSPSVAASYPPVYQPPAQPALPRVPMPEPPPPTSVELYNQLINGYYTYRG